MSRSVLVISSDANLVQDLRAHLHPQFDIEVVEDLKAAREQVVPSSFPVILAHWGPLTPNGVSGGN